MTVLSAQSIWRLDIIRPLQMSYKCPAGYSAGLSACGYDMTINHGFGIIKAGEFRLASVNEQLHIPANIVGIVHDKSSMARLGLAVQNTVAEPGWHGYLTLELSNHSNKEIEIIKGQAICQIIFHWLDEPTWCPYDGRYQNQGPEITESKKME